MKLNPNRRVQLNDQGSERWGHKRGGKGWVETLEISEDDGEERYYVRWFHREGWERWHHSWLEPV